MDLIKLLQQAHDGCNTASVEEARIALALVEKLNQRLALLADAKQTDTKPSATLMIEAKEGDWVLACVRSKTAETGVVTSEELTVEIRKRDGNRLRVAIEGNEESTKWIERSDVKCVLDKEKLLAEKAAKHKAAAEKEAAEKAAAEKAAAEKAAAEQAELERLHAARQKLQKEKSVVDEAALRERVREIEDKAKKQDTSMARVREQFGDKAADAFKISLQLTLGTPGVTAPYTFSGWLEKVSSSGTHWDKRWFVLTAGSYVLEYYKSAEAHAAGSEPLASLDLRDCCLQPNGDEGALKGLILHTSARKLKLRAAKQEDFTYWIDALKRFATGADSPPGSERSTSRSASRLGGFGTPRSHSNMVVLATGE